MTTRDRLMGMANWAGSLGFALLVWQLLAGRSDSFFFPAPSEIFPSMWRTADTGFGEPAFLSPSATEGFLGPGFAADVVPSLWRMLRGYTLATVVGVGAGVVLGLSETARQYTDWIVHFFRAIPPPALLGVWLVLFGIGDGPKVYLIAFAVFSPILLNTIDGIASVDNQRIQAVTVFKIPFRRRLTGLYLPSAAPKILSGMRISLGFAFVMMIISEFAGATNGLGLRLQDDLKFFNYVDLWATMIVLAVLGVLANLAFVAAENRVLNWQRSASKALEP